MSKKALLSLAFIPLMLLLVITTPAIASNLSDDFTGTDGTTLHNHNSAWNCANNANATIQSNKATSSSDQACTVSNGMTNGTVSDVVNFSGSSSSYASGDYVRYVDSNNWYLCKVNAADGYVIFKNYQGNFSVLQNNAGAPGAGNHNISCSINGSTITLAVDGVQRAQVTDTSITGAGGTGIQITSGVTVDDLAATPDANFSDDFTGTDGTTLHNHKWLGSLYSVHRSKQLV